MADWGRSCNRLGGRPCIPSWFPVGSLLEADTGDECYHFVNDIQSEKVSPRYIRISGIDSLYHPLLCSVPGVLGRRGVVGSFGYTMREGSSPC